MPSWTTIAVLCAFAAAVGIAADRFTLRRHKANIFNRLSEWWIRLDDYSFQDLPRVVAVRVLDRFSPVLGLGEGKKTLAIRLVLASVLLSFFAYMVYVIFFALDDRYAGFADLPSHGLLLSFQYVIFAIVNLPFDILTLLVTLKVLKIVKFRSASFAIPVILLDMVIAYVLFAIACATMYSLGDSSIRVFMPVFINAWGVVADALKWIITATPTGPDELLLTGVLSVTVFVPTIIYMGGLLFLSLGRVILIAGKHVILYLLEIVTDKPEPEAVPVFTLTATMFSTLAVIAKTVDHFLVIS